MIENLRLSLSDLLGADYTRAVCEARALLTGENPEALRALADEKIDWYPEAFARRQEELMERVGCRVTDGFAGDEAGAPTDSYRAAQHSGAAPLSAFGAFRVGEDGRLYFTGKSEHYQIPLGHDFPGYALVGRARALGVPNATHNNTRGFITRTLERRLIAAANGLAPGNPALEGVIASREPGVLSRVINLETGSLATTTAPPSWPRPCAACGPNGPERSRTRASTAWSPCPSTTRRASGRPSKRGTPRPTRPRASATRSS